MIEIYQKRNLLQHMLIHYVKDDTIYGFLKDANSNDELLNRFVFSKEMLPHHKYSVTLNLDKKHMLVRINGRYHNNPRLLNYIFRALIENNKTCINICIVSKKLKFKRMLENVCHSKMMVKEFINDSIVGIETNEVEKKRIMELIDKALDEGNQEEFYKLTEKYKELSL